MSALPTLLLLLLLLSIQPLLLLLSFTFWVVWVSKVVNSDVVDDDFVVRFVVKSVETGVRDEMTDADGAIQAVVVANDIIPTKPMRVMDIFDDGSNVMILMVDVDEATVTRDRERHRSMTDKQKAIQTKETANRDNNHTHRAQPTTLQAQSMMTMR
jgi:hypothetical protein